MLMEGKTMRCKLIAILGPLFAAIALGYSSMDLDEVMDTALWREQQCAPEPPDGLIDRAIYEYVCGKQGIKEDREKICRGFVEQTAMMKRDGCILPGDDNYNWCMDN
jgi:hypothetical protein